MKTLTDYLKNLWPKITEQEVTFFLERKVLALEKKLLRTKTILETLKSTHQVDQVKLKKKAVKSIKKKRFQDKKAAEKATKS